MGFPVHEVESARGGFGVLGWFFDGEELVLKSKGDRQWRTHLGVEELLRRPRVSGKELEAVVSHFTFLALVRRPVLSALSAFYASSGRH